MNPGFGCAGSWAPVPEARGNLEEYRTPRVDREAQVLAELKKHGRAAPPGLARRVYGTELGGELFRAAEMTLRAHLKKLIDDRKVKVRTTKGEEVYERSV